MMQKTTQQYDSSGYDAMDAMIADRFGERQRKLERMQEMEQAINRRTTYLRPVLVPLAAAASIAAIFVWFQFWPNHVSPWDELGLDRPELTAYRSATDEADDISRTMEAGEYEQALDRTARALSESDRRTCAAVNVAKEDADDESAMYALQLERSYNSELRWTYIYLLLKTGNEQSAQAETKRYLYDASNWGCSEHEADARKLLDKMKKK